MSGRSDDAAMLAALSGGALTGFLLFELYFDSGTQYISTCGHDVLYNGTTYKAIYKPVALEPLSETSQAATGLKLTMSGADLSTIAESLSEPIQGRKVVIHYAVIDGTTLRVDPRIWKGTFDTWRVKTGDGEAVIEVNCEHSLINWSRPSSRVCTDSDHRMFVSSTDSFYDFCSDTANRIIVFPSKQAQEK